MENSMDISSSESSPNFTVSSVNIACIAPTPAFERKKKHLQLPPRLNKHKGNILEVLHNHHLLRRKIWCQCRITSCNSLSGTTTSTLTVPHTIPLNLSVTFTDHDDGVPTLEEDLRTGISTLLCWSVTQGAYISGKDEDHSLVSGLRQPRYSLEERFTIQGSRLLWWVSTMFQDYHSATLRLMRLQDDVAAERQETQMNNELPSLDGKLKGE